MLQWESWDCSIGLPPRSLACDPLDESKLHSVVPRWDFPVAAVVVVAADWVLVVAIGRLWLEVGIGGTMRFSFALLDPVLHSAVPW